MPKLPDEVVDPIAHAIYQTYETAAAANVFHSRRLGAASLGEECDRRLWYHFRWCEPGAQPFEGRMLRLFETGHIEEARIVENLRAAGVVVRDEDPARWRHRTKQYKASWHGDHFIHYADGRAMLVPGAEQTEHVCEFKSANDKNFKAVKKKGVRVAEPKHWAQCQVGMLGATLTRCLYVVVNKNTDELWHERIHLDREEATRLVERAGRIIFAESPPVRITDDPADWRCKFCPAKTACHFRAVPDPSCRTCAHSTPEPSGGWSCDLARQRGGDPKIPYDVEHEGCPEHVYMPDLIPLEVVDTETGEWVEYAAPDGEPLRNGDGEYALRREDFQTAVAEALKRGRPSSG